MPSHIEFGVDRSGVHLPPGAVGNAVLKDALTRLLPGGASDLPVDRLALPFRCVASDLLTGALVDLGATPLFLSMRASLAMPSVLTPIRVNRRLLVDGGLVRNLPIDIARATGAEVIIAVNVGTPLAGEEELSSSLGVARQMLQILTEQNVQRSFKELAPSDVLISPELDGISFMNFGLSERAMAAGERATRLQALALAVSPGAYAAIGRSRVTARVPKQAAAPLLGGSDFERIGVDVRDVDGQRQVTITPVEAVWARSRVRLGLELSSDFSDDNQFTVSALHVLSWLNAWGREVRTLARVGSVRSLVIQPWQPLAPGSPWGRAQRGATAAMRSISTEADFGS